MASPDPPTPIQIGPKRKRVETRSVDRFQTHLRRLLYSTFAILGQVVARFGDGSGDVCGDGYDVDAVHWFRRADDASRLRLCYDAT